MISALASAETGKPGGGESYLGFGGNSCLAFAFAASPLRRGFLRIRRKAGGYTGDQQKAQNHRTIKPNWKHATIEPNLEQARKQNSPSGIFLIQTQRDERLDWFSEREDLFS
jgi:hypothetical protein